MANFDHLNPCKLYCQREGQSDFTVLEDVVSNGVSCHSHHFERGVCIDGSCIKVRRSLNYCDTTNYWQYIRWDVMIISTLPPILICVV